MDALRGSVTESLHRGTVRQATRKNTKGKELSQRSINVRDGYLWMRCVRGRIT